jgi:hypothetical protein
MKRLNPWEVFEMDWAVPVLAGMGMARVDEHGVEMFRV